jgi:putative ABC transport system ATP-binding protein
MSRISVRDLTKTYTIGEVKVEALRGVSLDINEGEFVAVVGPSGSGKSTFMHILGCLDRPTSGAYVLSGQDVSQVTADERARIRNRHIGFVFQSFNLLPRTPAVENVELPLLYNGEHLSRTERRRRASEALASLGLAERAAHHPSQLSGGQQQRVAIARALMNQPDVVLADEPTGNLDSQTSIEIMDVFQRLNETRGITLVVITHERVIAEYAHRIVEFRDGKIVSDRPIDKRRSAREEMARLAGHNETLAGV